MSSNPLLRYTFVSIGAAWPISGKVLAGTAPAAEGPTMAGEMTGFATMVGLIAVVALAFWLNHVRVRSSQKLVQAVLEKGVDLDRETLRLLLRRTPRRVQDLRRGAFYIAASIAIALFGFALDDPDPLRPLLGVAVVLAIFGVLYLVYARFLQDDL
ncbi:MAG TPA: hypothetical protein VF559_10045 [Caulobacteraceae bacterium]|jgi:hypothetical protein